MRRDRQRVITSINTHHSHRDIYDNKNKMSTHNTQAHVTQELSETNNHSGNSNPNSNSKGIATIGDGQYIIEKEIGKGSFAIVYRAHPTYNINKHFAIKAVSRSKLKNKKLLENLEIEIAILKKIKHKHIVSLIDCQRTDSDFYLIMEYCALGDLTFLIKKRRALMKNHPLLKEIFEKYPPPNENHNGLHSAFILNFLQQLASSLKFLRSKNLVHRDIKPQNLLLSTPLLNYNDSISFHKLGYVGIYNLPILKIADFGFARFLPNSSLAETLCGSPLYMAPEILNYQKYNAKADLWSVGTVLFEMGAGHPPFKASNHLELFKKIKRSNDIISFPDYFSTNYDQDTDLNEKLKQLICQLLTFDPGKRLTFDEFFDNELVTKDLSCFELDDNNSIDLETKSKHVVDCNMFISEYLSSPQKEDLQGKPLRDNDDKDIYRRIIQENNSRSKHNITNDTNLGPTTLSRDIPGTIAEVDSIITPLHNNIPKIPTNSDLILEKEYVVVEKKTVEVNELADKMAQLNTQPTSNNSNTATTNNDNNNNIFVTNASPHLNNNIPLNNHNNINSPNINSNNLGSKRNPLDSRRSSLSERRISITSLNPTNALSKALGIASTRIFGNNQHIKSNHSLTSNNVMVPLFNPELFRNMAEDMVLKVDNEWDINNEELHSNHDRAYIIHILEILSAKAFVVYSYAEVKFEQLVPLYSNTDYKRLSTGSIALDMEEEDTHQREDEYHRKEFAQLVDDLVINPELRLLCKEAITLYLKSLELLGNAMQITSKWWYEANEKVCSLKLNLLVQWIRDKFNECLEKAELLRLKLYESVDHDKLGNDHDLDEVYIEKLLYDRALEISKTAANMELHGKNLNGCEISYATSMWMLQTALENESSANILDDQDRNIIKKYIDSIMNRLKSLRLKMNNQN